ncbi:hypothetical protein BASA81_013161 [Batrachochytrium salamandrivorans]|nr:hypothetical protein BASA81_013161 [Batrachochytrium salamandrivorans]
MENQLQAWYGTDHIRSLSERLNTINFERLRREWKIHGDLIFDLVSLALYDVVFYIDDSGSMAFEEDGDRINDLELILVKCAAVTSLFDNDGIQLYFMNSQLVVHGVSTAEHVKEALSKVRFSGMTPLGTQFKTKVLEPLVVAPARNGTLTKPVLTVIVTDGEPTREPIDTLRDAIVEAKGFLSTTGYGPGAFAVQIGQVGTDLKAQQFLARIDSDPVVGGMVDCTSNYEMESEEMSAKGVELSPELWLLKLCVGAIDQSYDDVD